MSKNISIGINHHARPSSSIGITSTSSGTISYVSGSSGNSKNKFNILGEVYEHTGYIDGHIAVAISTINVLGKPFWDELKKNGVIFPHEMEQFIEKRITILERDKKIDNIIN
jgi:hypothetical protein